MLRNSSSPHIIVWVCQETSPTNLFKPAWLMQVEREIQRQNEYLRHAIDSPVRQLAAQMEDMYRRMHPDWVALIHSPIFHAMQRIQASASLSQALIDSSVLRAARAFETQGDSWRNVLDLPLQKLTEIDSQYQQLIHSVSMPALRAVSDEAIRYFQSASGLTEENGFT